MEELNRNTAEISSSKRQSSLELLRIICMFMIVMSHSIMHGKLTDFPLSLNGIVAIIMTQGARIAVNVFVFFTGYFSKNNMTWGGVLSPN